MRSLKFLFAFGVAVVLGFGPGLCGAHADGIQEDVYTFTATSSGVTGVQTSASPGTETYTFSPCGGNTCTLTVTLPVTNAQALLATGAGYVGEDGTVVGEIEANVYLNTDTPADFTEYTVTFTNFPTGDGTCASVGGCALTATGSSQEALELNFGNDDPTFESEVEDTIDFISAGLPISAPEPSSIALLAVGLAALALLAGFARRKQQTAAAGRAA